MLKNTSKNKCFKKTFQEATPLSLIAVKINVFVCVCVCVCVHPFATPVSGTGGNTYPPPPPPSHARTPRSTLFFLKKNRVKKNLENQCPSIFILVKIGTLLTGLFQTFVPGVEHHHPQVGTSYRSLLV